MSELVPPGMIDGEPCQCLCHYIPHEPAENGCDCGCVPVDHPMTDIPEELVEKVARAVHGDDDVFDDSTYVEAELRDWGDGDLAAAVDGKVNFTKLALAAIRAFMEWQGEAK